jgi:Mlc titration factor MtfA (ptsG expression regulator)
MRLRQNRAMLKVLLARLGASSRVVIPDELWNATLVALPFANRLAGDERGRLRALAEKLLGEKEMSAAGGLELTAQMQVSIAVQACLPVLNLGLGWYRGWTSIVVYPSEFLVPREITDASGVVHEFTEPLSGEAWEGGPLILSWDDARRSDNDGYAYSVVIHEFAHKIDLLDGEADGVPPFDRRTHPHLHLGRWRAALTEAFERFGAELDLIADELPDGVDPDSEEADRWFAGLPLDPYAGHDEGEFFAVSSETFFVDPARLREAFPDWYAQLALFFKQDPAAA